MRPFDEAWTVLKELPRFDVNAIENWSPHDLDFYTQGQKVGVPGEADLTVPSIGNIRVPTLRDRGTVANLGFKDLDIPIIEPREYEEFTQPISDTREGRVKVVSYPTALQHEKQYGPRDDLFTIGNMLRDAQGKPVGATSLTKPSSLRIPGLKPRRVA